MLDIKNFLVLVFLIPCSVFAFDPVDNKMAEEWNNHFASSSVSLSNHWYYTASGTVNEDFAWSHDENFFEVKMLPNRLLIPNNKTIIKKDKVLYYYGPLWYGLETRMIRIQCYTCSQETFADRFNGIGKSKGIETDFFEVIGSSTYLRIKNGKNRVRVIK